MAEENRQNQGQAAGQNKPQGQVQPQNSGQNQGHGQGQNKGVGFVQNQAQKPSQNQNKGAGQGQNQKPPAQMAMKMPGQSQGQNQGRSQTGTLVVTFVVGLIIGLVVGWGIPALRSHEEGSALTAGEVAEGSSTLAIATSSSGGSSSGNSSEPLVMAPAASQSSTSNVAMPMVAAASGTAITVASQKAGNIVFVTRVSFGSQIGWVTIQDDNAGQPGSILGAGLFGSGVTSGDVHLLRDTVPGHTYFAVLRENVGDYHLFNLKTDAPLMDASGNMIRTTFTVN